MMTSNVHRSRVVNTYPCSDMEMQNEIWSRGLAHKFAKMFRVFNVHSRLNENSPRNSVNGTEAAGLRYCINYCQMHMPLKPICTSSRPIRMVNWALPFAFSVRRFVPIERTFAWTVWPRWHNIKYTHKHTQRPTSFNRNDAWIWPI